MGDHVFICYARKDEGFVLKLAANLKGRSVPVWLDQWDIPLGANWNKTIDKAVSDCAYLLVVLSRESVYLSEYPQLCCGDEYETDTGLRKIKQ